jgi:F0F1-type ATP synthase membrane subunit b/b'
VTFDPLHCEHGFRRALKCDDCAEAQDDKKQAAHQEALAEVARLQKELEEARTVEMQLRASLEKLGTQARQEMRERCAAECDRLSSNAEWPTCASYDHAAESIRLLALEPSQEPSKD